MNKKTNNPYAKVIDFLINATDEDYRNVTYEIAKRHPALVIAAASIESDYVIDVIRTEYKANGKVSAIKLYRKHYDTDLHTSLRKVTDICSDLIAGNK